MGHKKTAWYNYLPCCFFVKDECLENNVLHQNRPTINNYYLPGAVLLFDKV